MYQLFFSRQVVVELDRANNAGSESDLGQWKPVCLKSGNKSCLWDELKKVNLIRLLSYSMNVFVLGLSPGGKIKLIKSSSISLQSPFRFVVVLALWS